jgi:mannosyltransferase OCH1-like enzyme
VQGFNFKVPNPDKPEKKTFNHDGNNGALRKALNALTSCSVVTFVVNFLLFVQGFNFKVPKLSVEQAQKHLVNRSRSTSSRIHICCKITAKT